MLNQGFVVAMAAEISFAAYEHPAAIQRKVMQWIIVSRCGPNSEFVTVANAAGVVKPGCGTPLGLAPIKTGVGVLTSESDDEIAFLLVRRRPPVLPVAGAFFPADGHIRIVCRYGKLELFGVGRHAQSRERALRKDVPDPAPNARGALAWHIHGIRREWVGELIPGKAPSR